LHKSLSLGLFFKSAEYGAQTTLFVSVAPELASSGGLYYENCRVTQYRNKQAYDLDVRVVCFIE
jgi:hypothetical protein